MNALKLPALIFCEQEFKRRHFVSEGAPCEWSKERGATHTLFTNELSKLNNNTRPAKIAKTRLYVGVDETPGGDIKWQTWKGRWI